MRIPFPGGSREMRRCANIANYIGRSMRNADVFFHTNRVLVDARQSRDASNRPRFPVPTPFCIPPKYQRFVFARTSESIATANTISNIRPCVYFLPRFTLNQFHDGRRCKRYHWEPPTWILTSAINFLANRSHVRLEIVTVERTLSLWARDCERQVRAWERLYRYGNIVRIVRKTGISRVANINSSASIISLYYNYTSTLPCVYCSPTETHTRLLIIFHS